MFAQSKYEMRAVWFTTNWGLDWPKSKATSAEGIARQQEELCGLLDQIKAMNLNVVFFQTRLRGDVVYPSRYEPWNYILTGRSGGDPHYDPLAFAIKACHERGLECHAWLVCMPLGSEKQVKAHGKTSVVSKHPTWCKKLDGEWYLNPGVPETAGYIRNLVGEIVSHYDVDGIHLDYIRYPDAAEKFKDNDTFKKYGSANQSLQVWRRENITRIVYAVYDEVKRLKPWVKVSSSPLGKYNSLTHYSSEGWSGMETVHQDAQKWLKEGKQDFVAPMIYFKERNFFPFLYNWIQHCGDRYVVSGLGAYRLEKQEGDWALSDLVRQITVGRELGADGQAYYRLENLIRNEKGIKDRLMGDLYRYPALVPPIPYSDSLSPDPPGALRVEQEDCDVRLSWKPGDGVRKVAIYGSDRYPVDINDATLLVDVVYDSTYVVTRAGFPVRNFYAVTAFDAYGNESVPAEIAWTPRWNSRLICVMKRPDLNLNIGYRFDEITVTNRAGRILFTRSGDGERVYLPDLQPGVYNLIIKEKQKVERKLLIIE